MPDAKEQALRAQLQAYGSVAIAFSGGVDSTYLAAIAQQAVPGRVLLLNAQSPSFPEDEAAFVRQFAVDWQLPLQIVDTQELAIAEYQENTPSRCYFCRGEMYGHFRPIVEAAGIAVLADGANVDDLGDIRPGMRAADEWQVRHPLQDVGLTKDEIRQLSRRLALPSWDKPSFACLASRIPFGERITNVKLRRVEAAERILREHGFKIYRVRSHEDLARLELGRDELPLAFARREELSRQLRALGYTFITLDLDGYRSGAMNESLLNDAAR